MRVRRFEWLQASLIGLPYLSYVGLLGLIVVTFSLLAKFRRSALDPITRSGLLLITGLMILSSLGAENRGEAFLQLANFLPFFLFFAVAPFLLQTVERLEQLAFPLVIAALPINGLALGEYLLRTEFVPQSWRSIPLVNWVRQRPHAGRATVMFNHPNALASYLVLILGLGLGLILYYALRQRSQAHPIRLPTPFSHPAWLYIGTYANLLGIFCSGSRNGLIVSIVQIVLFGLLWGLFTRLNRSVLWISLVSLGGMLTGAVWFGIGGRSLSLNAWANDARLRLWAVALDLIGDRPGLGWGLGNYKFQFPSRLLELYPTCAAVRDRRVVPVECADVTHPHNVWLLLAAEGGVLLAIGLTLWVGYLCMRGVRTLLAGTLNPADRALLLGYLLAFLGCITFAVFDVTLYDARVNALNWTILAGIYAFTQLAPSPRSAKPD